MTGARHYTEHSPATQDMVRRLKEEWISQLSRRNGKPTFISNNASNTTIFTRVALRCLNLGVDPARLVETAIELSISRSFVLPTILAESAVYNALNAVEGLDSEGNTHRVMPTRESMYHAEVNRAKALCKAGVPIVHLLDPSYGFRPLVLWVIAKKQNFESVTFFVEARDEYRRNRDEAEAVFGTDILKGLL